MLTDTHSHLNFPAFASDLPEVLARAETAGVRRMISIGTTLGGSREVVALAETYPNVFAAVGIHPNSAHETSTDFIDELRKLASNPRVVAIGEVGLDYFRLPGSQNGGTLETDEILKLKQAECFRRQLDLAVELGLNVIIHERSAWEDTLATLREYTGKLRAVFHCFGRSAADAMEVLNLGHLVSFTGIVTFKNAPLPQEAASQVPEGTYMVETDCPFLAPVPERGKRAEPAHTRLVAEHIAKLRGTSVEAVAEITEKTANRFFRFTREKRP